MSSLLSRWRYVLLEGESSGLVSVFTSHLLRIVAFLCLVLTLRNSNAGTVHSFEFSPERDDSAKAQPQSIRIDAKSVNRTICRLAFARIDNENFDRRIFLGMAFIVVAGALLW